MKPARTSRSTPCFGNVASVVEERRILRLQNEVVLAVGREQFRQRLAANAVVQAMLHDLAEVERQRPKLSLA